ncbi:LysR family transcriptional regulator [Phenylobacterium sp. LH3H17]|uniref:LysR family transcriptional regulator n=1 Tax=Phenylobacterium sp. LH3H17 TaxID=2903901 RepID=UPI0020C9C938|nr:LysR family transcriptional regulator [Phenylobacterium sp. LH3H17]UTP41363.1 LysR family transcriptional regulator [Phenylobacterium sp. LH3H17]
MDRLDELAVFVAVLETGGFAAAARKLRRSPPAVTRIVAGLEARAGARLIERTTRKLNPTEAGRILAEKARGLLAAYEEALAPEDDGPLRGLITLTAPLVFGRRHLTPVVASFLDLHPQVSVDLVLHDRNLDLIEGQIDLALRIGALADSGLVARRVGEVRRILVASPAYLARRGTPARPSDLTDHEIVLSGVLTGGTEWRFRDQAVRLTPRLSVNEVDAALIALRAGHGIGRPLSYQVAEDLASGALVRLLPRFEPDPLPVQLVAPSRHVSRKVRAFLDHAVEALSGLAVIRPGP